MVKEMVPKRVSRSMCLNTNIDREPPFMVCFPQKDRSYLRIDGESPMPGKPRRVLNKHVVEPAFVELPVDELKFDTKNQRLMHVIRTNLSGKRARQIDCEKLLWELPDTQHLFNDIKENGGLRQPLITDSDKVVIEGNRRLCCLKKLRQREPKNTVWKSVSVEMFPEDLPPSIIREFLFDAHVSGKKDWDAYERAEYIHHLYFDDGKTYEWLARNAHLSRSKIKQSLVAYDLTTEFLKEYPKADIRKFSYFDELAKKPELRRKVERGTEDFDPKFLKWFMKLVVNKRFTESKEVRKLTDILKNCEATEALERRGFSEANAYANTADPTLRSQGWMAVLRAKEAIKKLDFEEIADIGKKSDARVQLLRDLAGILRRIQEFTKISILD